MDNVGLEITVWNIEVPYKANYGLFSNYLIALNMSRKTHSRFSIPIIDNVGLEITVWNIEVPYKANYGLFSNYLIIHNMSRKTALPSSLFSSWTMKGLKLRLNLLCCWWLLCSIQNDGKILKMVGTLVGTQRELSNEYQHGRV